jgi:hypothetical protein
MTRGVRGEEIEVSCANCGAPFRAKLAQVKRGRCKYCSRQCHARGMVNPASLHHVPYAEWPEEAKRRHNAASRAWNAARPDAMRAASARYRAAHRDDILEAARTYRRLKRKHLRAAWRRYYRANRTDILSRKRSYNLRRRMEREREELRIAAMMERIERDATAIFEPSLGRRKRERTAAPLFDWRGADRDARGAKHLVDDDARVERRIARLMEGSDGEGEAAAG